MGQPSIDEMIAFMAKQQPNTLEQIRSENKAFLYILREGITLGDETILEKVSSLNSLNVEELKVRATVCSSTVKLIIEKCDEKIPLLKSKLQGNKNLQLYGQILTAVSSATVVTTLAAKLQYITYIAGVVSLIGSLLPMVVGTRSKSIDEKRSISDIYVELVKMRIEAEMNDKELRFFTENGFNIEGISDIVNKTNKICTDLNSLILFS